MKQVWQLFGWSVILLIGLFLSQDMCLWPAPAILHFPSIAVLFAGTFVIFAFLAAVPLGFFYAIRSILALARSSRCGLRFPVCSRLPDFRGRLYRDFNLGQFTTHSSIRSSINEWCSDHCGVGAVPR